MTAGPDAGVRMLRHEQAAAWLVARTDRGWTGEQDEAFAAWRADPDNRAALAAVERMAGTLDRAADTDAVIGLRAEALGRYHALDPARKAGRKRRGMLAALAASLLLALGGGGWWLMLPQRFETAVGEYRTVRLADGSRLQLDGNSLVTVDMDRDRRSLVLARGRARFDVAHDVLRPFTVAVGDDVVIATGTVFSVELLRRDYHVQLYQGSVAVVDRVGGAEAGAALPVRGERTLTPGQELVGATHGGGSHVRRFEPAAGDAWRRGELVFDSVPLADAAERVNRYNPRRVAVADDGSGTIRVSSVFRAGDGHAFVEGLSALYPLAVVPTDDGWRLRRR